MMMVDRAVLLEALSKTGADHGPGLFSLIVDDGEVVFRESFGFADLHGSRAIESEDYFRIGSVTKTYVAVLVLQLVADGTLSLTDTLEHWLPGMVAQGEAITVDLLLRLRSGLPDYVNQLFGDPPDISVLDRYWSPESLVEIALTATDRLPPDSIYRYCNTDYILLGLIVERATGQRVEAQLWQRIFKPAGLNHTIFPTVDPYIRGPHSDGHLREAADSPYIECTTLSPSEGWTAGAIVTTPDDLAKFFVALFKGDLLDPESFSMMTECTEQLDARARRGLGIARYDFDDGTVAFGHHGGVPGYTTLVLWTEYRNRCVVLYQNCIDMHDVLYWDTPFIRAALVA
jgi:D-alanyl-D-alanine carboxypeptidase